MDIIASLRGVSKEIRRKRRYATDETKTINFLVHPLIRALGYDPASPDDVTPEFTAGYIGKSKKIDLVLRKDGEPIIFVEVKSATRDLAHEHTEQLQNYFSTKLTVRFGILTNGLEYRFYSDIDNQNIMDDEPFLTVDMFDFDEANVANMGVYEKSAFQVDSAKLLAIRLKYRLMLQSVLESEFASPSDDLITLLIRRIRPELKSVTKKVRAEMTPIVKEVWSEFTDGGLISKPRPKPTKPEPSNLPSQPDVIEVPVFAYHKKQRFEATLLVDEIMNWHKRTVYMIYESNRMSCADTTRKALLSVSPNRTTSKSAVRFWKFIHPITGKELTINDIFDDVQKGGALRQQLAAKYT